MNTIGPPLIHYMKPQVLYTNAVMTHIYISLHWPTGFQESQLENMFLKCFTKLTLVHIPTH